MTITTIFNQLFNQLEVINLNAAQDKMVWSICKSIKKALQ